MIYVALLRGINVGGKNKVDMKLLKETFERLGLKNVKTYINSGNIIFSDKKRSAKKLTELLETAIKRDFGFEVRALLRDSKNIKAVTEALPSSWTNDASMKCDVMFLWPDRDSPKILEQLTIKPEIDDVRYVEGALLWSVDRKKVTKSGMMKLAGNKLYKNMTIRNCNTVRKIMALIKEAGFDE
ncbi:MAG TPA: DUF1697 domain-containing protein [Pyrinomonadaceae bacterium]|nr:DUF1697 domain-containing protein [Pyrinomonadaceae bacterium]HMP64516.1 DUF1697 domain-containing protein [Pyrinomonadaceae bacterium]